MKKLLVLLAAVLLISCSKNDDDVVITHQIEYNVKGTNVNCWIDYAGLKGPPILFSGDASFYYTSSGSEDIFIELKVKQFGTYEISIIRDSVLVDYFISYLSEGDVVFLNY